MSTDNPLATLLHEEKLFIQAVQDTFMVNMCTAAALTWLAYDILLNIEQEITLIWRAKWSLSKVLYFLVRYYTLLSLILNVVVNTNSGVGVKQDLFTDINRIVVTTGCGSQALLCFILFLYLGPIINGIVTACLELSSIRHATPRIPHYPIPGCLFTPPAHTRNTLISWIVNMSVACVYLSLMLYKFGRNIILTRNTASDGTSITFFELRHISPLIYLFIRDGAFYFFIVFVANVINLVFSFVLANRAIENMGTAWFMAVYGVMSPRLCLNLRGVAQLGQDDLTENADLGSHSAEFICAGTSSLALSGI
ncbi:hypothetical protein A0H81_00286 [Grifola frondosa]|uniref:DUF6533 domain-containing protein n=1 Tax=Grifola frondosa TaxID=5627 RepID=A0A1C7MQE7_GRIFR|nr:hypothetical protein A0H81_00286 [Grifola frondosa]